MQFSSPTDNTLKVWDLVQKVIISSFIVEKVIKTCDISPDGVSTVDSVTSAVKCRINSVTITQHRSILKD